MVTSIPWDEICGPEEDPVSVGDVLTHNSPEPPRGTVVQLVDGERWKRIRPRPLTYRRWQWVRLEDGIELPNTRWKWPRITFDGPVTVVEVSSDR